MTDAHDNRRRLTTTLVIVLACLVPILTAAVGYLIVRDVRQGRELVQQNVRARYDDCLQGEQVRSALREQVEDQQRTNPLLFKLVPSLDTPEIRRIIRQRRDRQLRAYAPRDCGDFALQAVPPGDRGSYSVP